ncbi:Methyl-CpG-binding domain-containing protein 8 [Zea mays]|uniref:Methyl-CpG-binding domain-containing protein 8 n=1 Tax=Zea mays TaxID=4577 RepID=A0A1D6KHW8_MAIZE|nr:Methyl-CpG-binding domain-containing protein 8 [Zea mays]
MLSSPKGSHFSTCKDVSAYLMALLGYPELKPATNKYESTGQPYSSANDGDDSALCFQDQIGSIMDKTNAQHHLAYHEMSVKRRRTGKFGEPVVGKDGKFECPICHKTFEEEPQYFGHVGSHARYEGLAPEAFLDKATSRRAANDSLAEIPFSLQELTESHGQNNKVSYGEKGFQHHNHSNKHGDNNLTAIDLFGTNYSDNFIRPNKTWGSPEEGPSCNDAPSVSRYTNFTGHADVIVSERASISNNQSVSNINGFIFSDQPGGNHVVRPTASADNNTVKARDVNLNSCASASTISFPIAYANNETSAALNEANRSSSTAKCFSGSFNNNDGACSASSSCGPTNKISSSFGTSSKTQAAGSRSIGASYEPYGEDCSALKANPFASKNNTSVYQYNLATQPVYAVAARADCFASGSEQTKNSDKELASSAKQRIDNVENRTSKEAGFVAEAYNSGAFNGGITEKGFAQISNSFTHIKSNASGSCSLPESKTPTNGSDSNCIKGSLVNRGDDSFTKVSIVNRPINNNESNVARLEAMGKLNDEMQNRYNYHAPGIDPHVAASASRNANGFMPMQANFGCMSSTVQSVVDVSVSSTSQDQCWVTM